MPPLMFTVAEPLASSAQVTLLDPVILAVIGALSSNVVLAVAVHPPASVMLTE